MLNSPHVLVAEDEDLVATALAEALESNGFRDAIAHDGAEALRPTLSIRPTSW